MLTFCLDVLYENGHLKPNQVTVANMALSADIGYAVQTDGEDILMIFHYFLFR
jgi:hypothetical protein